LEDIYIQTVYGPRNMEKNKGNWEEKKRGHKVYAALEAVFGPAVHMVIKERIGSK